MRAPKHTPMHECCPEDWRKTPVFTGSHELDAVIHRNTNGNIPARMKLYAGGDSSYGPRTGYNGYHGYGGDD